MRLSCHELLERKIVHIDQIQNSLIHVHLDCTILIEKVQPVPYMVNLSSKEYPEFLPLNLGENGYAVRPHQFVLATTKEFFNLSKDVVCQFKLNQKLSNVGFSSSLTTDYDSSWNHMKLTFGLKNQCEYHSLLLKSGMEIGQVFFYRYEG
jgi:deoxycytidine triphosphate deaminase